MTRLNWQENNNVAQHLSPISRKIVQLTRNQEHLSSITDDIYSFLVVEGENPDTIHDC